MDDPRLGPLNQHGLQRLAYDKGVFFLTSSQTFQQAREYGQFGHGILTYVTVVEGLEQRLADREPRDGAVDWREMFHMLWIACRNSSSRDSRLSRATLKRRD